MSARPTHGIPQFESLEPRLLLSGTDDIVDSLADAAAPDSAVALREVIEAAKTGPTLTDDPTPGDANHDGRIDGMDLAIWQINYDPLGSNPTNTWEMGDWNGDGKIDGADLALH